MFSAVLQRHWGYPVRSVEEEQGQSFMKTTKQNAPADLKIYGSICSQIEELSEERLFKDF